jgi:hypothetical protein
MYFNCECLETQDEHFKKIEFLKNSVHPYCKANNFTYDKTENRYIERCDFEDLCKMDKWLSSNVLNFAIL